MSIRMKTKHGTWRKCAPVPKPRVNLPGGSLIMGNEVKKAGKICKSKDTFS